MKTLTSKGYKAFALACLVLVSPVQAATIHDDAYLEAACEGRYPGRFVEVSNVDSYDCETGEIVETADPFGCKDSTLAECYGDE